MEKTNKEISFNEDITKVYGQNKAGKSSLRHAFLWLITGYDGENRMNYNLFDNTKTYTPEDSPAAVVEAIIEANGYEYSLKKQQKWDGLDVEEAILMKEKGQMIISSLLTE